MLILSSFVIQLLINVPEGHVLLTGYGITGRGACFFFPVWERCMMFSQFIFIWKPTWVGGRAGWRRSDVHSHSCLSVQYCVPHRGFGDGQGRRNRIRTIFLQVLYFRSPGFIVVECSDVRHLLDSQQPGSLLSIRDHDRE